MPFVDALDVRDSMEEFPSAGFTAREGTSESGPAEPMTLDDVKALMARGG